MSRSSHLSPDNILRFLQVRTAPASADEIAAALHIRKADRRPLFKMLAKLKKRRAIEELAGERYRLPGREVRLAQNSPACLSRSSIPAGRDGGRGEPRRGHRPPGAAPRWLRFRGLGHARATVGRRPVHPARWHRRRHARRSRAGKNPAPQRRRPARNEPKDGFFACSIARNRRSSAYFTTARA